MGAPMGPSLFPSSRIRISPLTQITGPRGTFLFASLLPAMILLAACKGEDPALSVWTPADHNNQTTPNAGQVDTEKPRPNMPDLTKHGVDEVVLATWKQNCMTCHGVIGRGDGPQGAMMKPPDFTSAAFQSRALDSELKHAIQKGRGRMPAFPQIPDKTVDGLISLIRMLSSGQNQGASSAADTAP